MIRGLLAWLGGCLLAAASTPAASAQARTEVLLNSDAVGPDAFKILESAFARDGIAFMRAASAPQCVGTVVEEDVRARVWITWSRGSSLPAENTMQLCFQDHCRSTERGLEPFAKIDARAREELITVVESGLAALHSSCPETPTVPSSEQSSRSRASGTRDGASLEHATEVPDGRSTPTGARGLNALRPNAASAATTTDQAPRSGLRSSSERNPQKERAAATGASTGESPPRPQPPPSAAAHPDSLPPHPERAWLALGASYGFTRWAERVVGQKISGMVAYAIQTQRPIYLGLEVSYVPRFRVPYDDLAINATCVRVALRLSASWPLSRRWTLDAQLGPAIEWISLAPDARTASMLLGPRSASHGDPLLFARLGPALRLYSGVLVGLEAQLDSAWIQRNFGFMSSDGPIRVFTPDRFRLSIALNLRAEL